MKQIKKLRNKIVYWAYYHIFDISHNDSKKTELLYYAMCVNNLELFDLVVSYGIDLNTLDVGDVMFCINDGKSTQILNKLLNYGMHINNKSSSIGWNMLDYAIYFKNLDIAKLLIERNIDFCTGSVVNLIIFSKNKDMETLLEVLISKGIDLNHGVPIFFAIKSQNIEVFKILVSQGAALDVLDNLGRDPLMLGLFSPKKSEILSIFQLTPRFIETKQKLGYNDLHMAVLTDNVEKIKVLLRSVENIDFANNAGYSALHLAVLGGNCKIIKLLLEKGSNINAQTKNLDTPMHLALCCVRFENVLRLLLDYNPDLSIKNIDDKTPTERFLPKLTLEFLLKNHPDIQDDSGQTGLMLSIVKRDFDKFKNFVERTKNIDHANKEGKTALHIAVQNHLNEYIDLLIQYGANAQILNHDEQFFTEL